MKIVLLLFVYLTAIQLSMKAQGTYLNSLYNFSFNYPSGLSKLSDDKLNEINNASYNKQMGITFEAGFENTNNTLPPLILVYVLKGQNPSEFNKTVEKYTNNDINITKNVNAFNNIIPIINSASIDKPLVDLENKILIFTGEMDLEIWPYSSKGKGMFILFYGKEKIVQINFATTLNDFNQNFENYFLPIISSFSFKRGFEFN